VEWLGVIAINKNINPVLLKVQELHKEFDNKEILKGINLELTTLGKENFIHKACDETLKSVYGSQY
jgi:hypothetical protein